MSVAECVDTFQIQQYDGINITGSTNYACDPTNSTSICKIYFDKSRYFEVQCKCSLNSAEEGFCDSIIGTSDYQNDLILIKYMHEMSQCHTLDRNNYRA